MIDRVLYALTCEHLFADAVTGKRPLRQYDPPTANALLLAFRMLAAAQEALTRYIERVSDSNCDRDDAVRAAAMDEGESVRPWGGGLHPRC